MFTVTCLSEGGRVVSSSLTGPNSENLGQLQPVEEQYEGRGDDHFSLSVTRPGGEDGDVFTCTASTEWSTHTSDSVLSGWTNHRHTPAPHTPCLWNVTPTGVHVYHRSQH